MLNQKKVEIFLVKIRKSLAKQFLEVALTIFCGGDVKATSKRRGAFCQNYLSEVAYSYTILFLPNR